MTTSLVVAGRDVVEDPRKTVVSDKLALARRQFRTAMAAETELRANQHEDLKFCASDQWDLRAKSERQLDRRPCLTINRLNQFVRQVVNAARQMKPAIQVSPIDSGADQQTAEVYQGIIRHIEQQSDALAAYITASEAQARIGRGWWRIVTEFDDELESFAQRIKIKRVRNAFTIVWDPASQELDGSDARWAFVVEDMPADTYKQRYGDASFASLTEFMTGNDQSSDWMPEGRVRVAEWWTVQIIEDSVILVLWPDRQEQVVRGSIYDTWPEEKKAQVQILRSRRLERREVRCAVINAVEILEGNDDKTDGSLWPGQWIPIVPVYGEEIDLNGKLDYRGMVRDAKDPQRLYNYETTALAEALQLAPKSPFMGAAGAFENHEQKYEQANRRNFPYLEYNPQVIGGIMAPPPHRLSASADIGGFVQAVAQGDNDLKATTGLFDASLGNRQGDQSGKAIQSLQRQGEMANSNFLDNLSRAVRFTGRLLVDLIPHIYDAPKVMRILGTDDKPKDVLVMAGVPEAEIDPKLREAVDRIYDLSVGRYDVSISVGPSLESRRQEALTGMTGLLQAAPQLAAPLADLIVANMDFPQADVAATRLRKMLPPQLQDNEDGEDDIPPQVQAQMMQAQQQMQGMGQQMQAMQAALAEAERKLQAKDAEMAAKMTIEREKIASDQQIARMRAEADIIKAEIAATKEKALAEFHAHMHGLESAREHERRLREQAVKDAQVARVPDIPPAGETE